MPACWTSAHANRWRCGSKNPLGRDDHRSRRAERSTLYVVRCTPRAGAADGRWRRSARLRRW
jgi:hypothetical protein